MAAPVSSEAAMDGSTEDRCDVTNGIEERDDIAGCQKIVEQASPKDPLAVTTDCAHHDADLDHGKNQAQGDATGPCSSMNVESSHRVSSTERAKSWLGLTPESPAIMACWFVNLLDVMGVMGTNPILVSYGRSLGASLSEIAFFNTTRFAFGTLSTLWMSRLSDTRGPKLVFVISIVGSGLGYLIQGTSWVWSQCPDSQTDCSARGGVFSMIVGRAVSGIFAGTKPVVRSWLASVSHGNPKLMKRRMALMMSSGMSAPFTLAPVFGAIATLELFLPWLVAAGSAVAILAFTLFAFKGARKDPMDDNVGDGKGKGKGNGKGKGKGKGKGIDIKRKPVQDPVLIIFFLIQTTMGIAIASIHFIVPVTLEQPKFGLVDASSEGQTRKNVAATAGVVGIPFGILNLLTATIIAIKVADRIGDRNTLRLACCIAPLGPLAQGLLVRTVWHMTLAHAITGFGFGLWLPLTAAMLGMYAARCHCSRMAQAQSFPMLGMNVGMMLGPQVQAAVIDSFGIQSAWILCCCLLATGLLLLSEVATRITSPKEDKSAPSVPEPDGQLVADVDRKEPSEPQKDLEVAKV